jgi:hypothetical protein
LLLSQHSVPKILSSEELHERSRLAGEASRAASSASIPVPLTSAFATLLSAPALPCGQELVRAQNDWSTPLPTVYFEKAPKLFELGFRESIEPKALVLRHYSFSH